MSQPEIPTLRLEGADWTEPPTELAAQFDAACREVGFLLIEDHGVDAEAIETMIAATHAFFGLPIEVKQKYKSPTGSVFFGYSNVGQYEAADAGRAGEGALVPIVESYRASVIDDDTDAHAELARTRGHEPNYWPDEIEHFRSAWMRYMAEMQLLAGRLGELAAHALGLDPGWFEPYFSQQTSSLLTNHYLPQDTRSRAGSPRFEPHTDFGGFTILYQDTDVGGLEIFTRDERWVRVPASPGTYVVNLGDMLAKWTNDRWLATLHRVRRPEPDETDTERLSAAFFHRPNFDASISTIPTCVTGERQALPEPVTWYEWVNRRARERDAELAARRDILDSTRR